MISVGIFTGYYPYTIDETIKRINESGFSCVQLDVSFKDCDATKEELTKRPTGFAINFACQSTYCCYFRIYQLAHPNRA